MRGVDRIVTEETENKAETGSQDAGGEGFSMQAIHLVRTTQNNTLALSAMADQKASILMGATFLVFSLSVSRAFTVGLSWSMMILAGSAFISTMCAVMAVLPSVGKPMKGAGPLNKLFFGHFTNMDEEQWMREVLDQLRTDEGVFRTMLHDIYQNGQVLQRRKYKFLSLAYRIFIVGLFGTMTAYLVESAGFM